MQIAITSYDWRYRVRHIGMDRSDQTARHRRIQVLVSQLLNSAQRSILVIQFAQTSNVRKPDGDAVSGITAATIIVLSVER